MSTEMTGRMDVELTMIVVDPGLQPRESMDPGRIVQYAEDMMAGVEFPPIRVYRVPDQGGRYYLTSGFHRYYGAEQAGLETIACEVIEGTFAEAKWDAAGSNTEWDSVGMPRKREDLRRAVKMALEVMPDKSDRAIAAHVGVTDKTIASHRKPLTSEFPMSTSRNGVDGIDRKMPFIPGTRAMPITNGADHAPSSLEVLPSSIAAEVRPAARSAFNQTNEMVDWARWTWNPVTGCEHNCVYCYARDIANRFYAEKFAPTYRPERLDAPRATSLPGIAGQATDPVERTSWRNVFVCSMADLFGRWVPDGWIEGVFDSCRQSPQWNYLFLTKFPQRYVGLDFPATAWVGTSVDEQRRVPNAEKAFRKIESPVKWLSVEPMQEPIEFTDMKMFDWVVIGGRSRSSGAPEFHPEPAWVARLIDRALAAGCAVYCKPNTDPGGHWAGLFKQYPRTFTGPAQ